MESEGRLEARALRIVWRGMFSTERGCTGLRRALKDAAGVLRKAGDGALEIDGEEEGGDEGELKCSAGGFEWEEGEEDAGRSDATVPLEEEEMEEEEEDGVGSTKDALAPVDDDGDMVKKRRVQLISRNQIISAKLDDEFIISRRSEACSVTGRLCWKKQMRKTDLDGAESVCVCVQGAGSSAGTWIKAARDR